MPTGGVSRPATALPLALLKQKRHRISRACGWSHKKMERVQVRKTASELGDWTHPASVVGPAAFDSTWSRVNELLLTLGPYFDPKSAAGSQMPPRYRCTGGMNPVFFCRRLCLFCCSACPPRSTTAAQTPGTKQVSDYSTAIASGYPTRLTCIPRLQRSLIATSCVYPHPRHIRSHPGQEAAQRSHCRRLPQPRQSSPESRQDSVQEARD